MKYIKRISLIVVAVLVLACSVPLSSMAVDPVSAATMANAFAQAITAYGASQGVSMTFDVANTDGIGEGVHDLWEQYASDMAQSNMTVSDYSNLAASVFPTLWKKTFDYVTVSLDAATVGEIDGFWNWLLSGPAEMTKVDNEYYQWTVNQSGNVDPIIVHSSYNTPMLPYVVGISNPNNATVRASGYLAYSYNNTVFRWFLGNNSDIYIFYTADGNIYICSPYTSRISYMANENDSVWTMNVNYNTDNISGLKYTTTNFSTSISNSQIYIPYFATFRDGFDYIAGIYNGTTTPESGLSVRPYVGDTAPQNVYIPDNSDVNYSPVAAEIPLDIPWNDELYGDGTGTLTDAQSEAITEAADDAITDNPDKTLELADTAPTPPVPDPSEVYIPFLPVTLPSFQFSLSGIWHYVTAWVASLGAWFSLVFTTWSYLPYAISVPVYATAVIVIVLGVYKRFFM